MDDIVDLVSLDGSTDASVGGDDATVFRLCVNGKPKPYPRPRINYAFRFYNPATAHINAFKNQARAALPSSVNNGDVLFDNGTPVTVHIIFYLPRPNEDFIAKRRMPGNLKPSARVRTVLPIGADIDNLTKVVLDGLAGVVYRNDRQVVKLVAHKVRDNYMLCTGSTVVEVSKFGNDDIISEIQLEA